MTYNTIVTLYPQEERKMKSLVKWVLAPMLVSAGLIFAGADRAEAHRRVVRVYHPIHHARVVYRHPLPVYRPVPVRVNLAPVIAYPAYRYRYIPAPVVVPYPAW